LTLQACALCAALANFISLYLINPPSQLYATLTSDLLILFENYHAVYMSLSLLDGATGKDGSFFASLLLFFSSFFAHSSASTRRTALLPTCSPDRSIHPSAASFARSHADPLHRRPRTPTPPRDAPRTPHPHAHSRQHA
jgi:hypothetical protein